MEEAKKILQKTHGGLDVFKHYLGEDCTAQFFRNPYRKALVSRLNETTSI